MTNKGQCRGSDNDDQRHWLIIWIGADELLKRLPVGGGGVDGGGGDTIGVSRNIQIRISNKLTKLGRCDRETIELANHSNDSIVRTAGRASK